MGTQPPRLPAEWEPQSAVMLTWPHPDTDWAPRLSDTLRTFTEVAVAIGRDQQVLNVCRDREQLGIVQALLAEAGLPAHHLCFALADSNDTWARDHAPITVLQGDAPVLLDFTFDGWGGKFAAAKDNAISRELAQQGIFGDTPIHTHELVLEGGALETDGLGTLLATRSSVLDPRRNPGSNAEDIERLLGETLGIKRFLWLDHGELSGDDTDAHIDILARFTDPNTIVFSSAPPNDPDHAALQAMREQLASFRDNSGLPYRLVALPSPGILRDADGRRLPAGYANFLVTNRSVLLPVYGVSADQVAADRLGTCFPTRRILPIDCSGVVQQNGSLHCLTMQFPSALTLQPPADPPVTTQ